MTKAKTPSHSNGRSFELFDELMPVRRYKLLLQTFLKRRGPGARQAFAEALGHTRSFVTQITSPAYDLAISAAQVRAILRLGVLTAEEERVFLEAYVAAHPDRASDVYTHAHDGFSLALPDLDDPVAQARMEALIRKLAEGVIESFLEEARARRKGDGK
ncbi:hypothetical protein [Tropicimonas sp. IMCC34043]|uniref:hypothetical protein n=1 Tax=Tropicimonas sp. IMCC34043 TaxID=2248760 RepID=UPI000E25A8F4|nr:hypothetical protein [Tropicimonas sp. IMCC34043]